jgi:hypothetical protein
MIDADVPGELPRSAMSVGFSREAALGISIYLTRALSHLVRARLTNRLRVRWQEDW